MSTQVVGIDIGSRSIRAIELRNPRAQNPSIVRFHEVPLNAGSVSRGEVLEVATVASAIKQLWTGGGFTTKNVILGMGGSRVLSRDLVMPKAPLWQIKESLPFHVGDMLPVPVSEALLDFYPISEEIGETGPGVKGLLIAVIKDTVSANVAAVTQAGLRAVEVDLSPFALARALAPVRTARGLSAIVSIGANSTTVVVVLDGVPQFVRIIASGGDDITTALAIRLQLSQAQAEQLKRQVGLGFVGATAEQLTAIALAQELTSTLLISLRDTLTFFIQGHDGERFDNIILSGGGSKLSGLARALGQLVSIPIEQTPALNRAQLTHGSKSRATPDQLEAMTTAYGLALGTIL